MANCAECKGLCCIGFEFKEGDRRFPGPKAEGERCRHLTQDFKCGVHAAIADGKIYPGCREFDCEGMGPEACEIMAISGATVEFTASLFESRVWSMNLARSSYRRVWEKNRRS